MEQPGLKTILPFPSIRAQLLIISLVVLILPWIGLQTIRDMEGLLRQQQVQQLMTMATTIRDGMKPVLPLFMAHHEQLQGTPRDSEIVLSSTDQRIIIDGYADDWPEERYRQTYDNHNALRDSRHDTRIELTLSSYFQNRSLILLLDITDDQLYQTRNPVNAPRDGDHILLGLSDNNGQWQYIISSNSPGWLSVVPTDSPTLQETRIQAEMQARHGGYTIEIAIPEYLASPLLSIHAVDRDNADPAYTATIGNVPLNASPPGGLIFTRIDDISRQLANYRAPGQRLSLLDKRGNILAADGNIESDADIVGSSSHGVLQRLHELLLLADAVEGEPLQQPFRLLDEYIINALNNQSDHQFSRDSQGNGMLSVAVPVLVNDQPAGAVLIQQSTDAISGLRYQALLNITLTSLAAMAIVVLVLLAYATVLIRRIRNLNRQMQSSVTDDGRLGAQIPVSVINDEIGELNRGMAMMIDRLRSYQHYLESMASKLSHELRTPMTVVQSSLENLQGESRELEQHPLIARANDGMARLKTILANLTEASRLENALKTTDVERFDLCQVVAGCINGYQQAFTDIDFRYTCQMSAFDMHGSADLIAQLMDKLVANAMDFHSKDTSINITLSPTAEGCRLCIHNQGEPVPADILNTMFDSMTSARSGTTETPHMGLGLYVVRLIAVYHGATPTARNEYDGVSVCIGFNTETNRRLLLIS